MNYRLYELRTKSEGEVAIGRCDLLSIGADCWFNGTQVGKFSTYAEGSDRLAHGEQPLRLVKDQNRPPYAQIRLEGTR